ncbi:protein translocase subunit SecD [Bailinhaonella thermotolerans]|uniref:Multifunctional fusion protein n=1 Tax=Bailinhaonella thermotolerans TaxID=1070861 RepID=A0A3A4BBU8_9ACTN|nr:protein translocase subunit SecD [Bailinhaonella thermotolerans]RJL31648.1 protein translocase subunit SecD [Bailinhaonella thermotolerans]
MSRAAMVRALLALAVIAGSLWITLTQSPRLGLDLRGGTQLVFETKDSPTVKANAESTDRTLEVLRRRADALGVAEPTLVRSGEKRIVVELPGVQDPRKAAEVIGKTAQLTFHAVKGVGDDKTKPGPGEQLVADESGQKLLLGPAALTGDGVSKAEAGIDSQGTGAWFVQVQFRDSGDKAWVKLTGDAACKQPGDPARRVAIVLDNKIISSPQVTESIQCQVGIQGGTTQITGSFTGEEANELAILIQGGALPVPVTIVEQRTVGPTLGAAAIDASFGAGIIGVALTGLFIIVMYRLSGFLATVALASYALISYAVLVALGATLTLPGLAGFVLAIGMAVDANVLVFERAREEYAEKPERGLHKALLAGFRNAWSAVADSNVTTVLAAGLLFFLASGPVRGFGVTLTIGVLASMVSAMLITRVLTETTMKRRFVGTRPVITGIGNTGAVRQWLTRRNFDLMSRRKLWLAISGAALVLAVAGIAVKGLNLGIEFTGGRLMEYSTSQTLSADRARELVSGAGFSNAVVQNSDDGISVRTGQIGNDDQERIRAALATEGGNVVKLRDELIGPSLGDELRQNALIALAVALLAQLLYLAVRFRWTFGLASVLAMFHDVAIVVGVFAWLGKPIDGVFLAAILTVVGYSVNDKVVVFDRVREMWGADRTGIFARIANSAILQTVPRTVNTGLGALFILAALAVLGGDSLRDFAIALLVGIGVGTWSSAFTATPLAIVLEKRNSAPPPKPVRAAKPKPTRYADRRDSGAVV